MHVSSFIKSKSNTIDEKRGIKIFYYIIYIP